MIEPGRLGGSGGGYSTTNDDDDSGSSSSSGGGSASVTSISDPVFGGGSGGKTGSEIMAEGGDPASTVTNDPHEDSVSEKYDSPESAINDMVDRATSSDDPEGSVEFDNIQDNEQGKTDLQDSVDSIVSATSGGGSNAPIDNTDQNQAPTPEMPSVPFEFPTVVQQGGQQAKVLLFALVAFVAAALLGGQ